MAATIVVTTALKVSADISMSTHAPLNSNGFSVLKRKGSLMPARASWSGECFFVFFILYFWYQSPERVVGDSIWGVLQE